MGRTFCNSFWAEVKADDEAVLLLHFLFSYHLSLSNLLVTFCLHRPIRGGEKLELPQPMLSGLQREQQRPPPPPLHPPPPHRAWTQLGQLYDSHLPSQDHPVVPLPNEHSLRLHNGGYAGSGGPLPNPHHPHSRPNQVLRVSHNANGRFVHIQTCVIRETHCCCCCCLLQFGGPQEQQVPRGPPLLGDEMWAQVHQVGAL